MKAKRKVPPTAAPAAPVAPPLVSKPGEATFDWTLRVANICIPANPEQLERASTVEIQRLRSVTSELNRALWLEWSRRKNIKTEGMGLLADMDRRTRDHALKNAHQSYSGSRDKDWGPVPF